MTGEAPLPEGGLDYPAIDSQRRLIVTGDSMPGPPGTPGFAKTAASFVQPSVGAVVAAVPFDPAFWVPQVGTKIGGGSGIYLVEASASNQLNLRLLEQTFAPPGTVVGLETFGAAGESVPLTAGVMAFNVGAVLDTAASSSSSLESTLISVDFIAPASGTVWLAGCGTVSYPANNPLEVYIDVAGFSRRVPCFTRGNVSTPLEGISPFGRFTGLLAGTLYTARIRWRSSSGTRSCSPLTTTTQAARVDVFDIA